MFIDFKCPCKSTLRPFRYGKLPKVMHCPCGTWSKEVTSPSTVNRGYRSCGWLLTNEGEEKDKRTYRPLKTNLPH